MLKYIANLLSAIAGADSRIEIRLAQIQTTLKEIQNSMSTQNSAIQAFAAQVKANLSGVKDDLTSLKTGVGNLDAKIVDLQKQLAAGSSTIAPADAAALQDLVDSSAALKSQADGISTDIPVPEVPATPTGGSAPPDAPVVTS